MEYYKSFHQVLLKCQTLGKGLGFLIIIKTCAIYCEHAVLHV